MLVLGMMSGTSADGIDVALARILGRPPDLKAKLIDHASVKCSLALRKEIYLITDGQLTGWKQITEIEKALETSRREIRPHRLAWPRRGDRPHVCAACARRDARHRRSALADLPARSAGV